ncbi:MULTISPECIES: hypothetical protein [Deinococcus]|uniref:Uncharacterized protein n=1 Tax=Deinococcus rufus TaxID=2136097 RepID=A0ABV7Z9V3_9DEIO|nr:hypothetical protein [Deinococcus sp. AB2017081]WQE94416.1 hypothetical protein U2P90_13505 [Deinococcus sp. AB2017081]
MDTIIPQLSFDGIIYPTRIIKAYDWNKDKWWKAFGNLTTRYKEFIEVTVHWGSDGKKTVDSVYGEDALTITEIN